MNSEHVSELVISTQEFLRTLFPTLDGSYIEIRLLGDQDGLTPRVQFFESVEAVMEAMPGLLTENQQGYGVFFGVCPRSIQGNGKKESVKTALCVWADMDAKDFEGGEEEAKARLFSFPLKPSIVVESGHGFHAYWLFAEPWDASTKAGQAIIERINLGLVKALNADSTSKEIARVLRLPGTLNMKKLDDPKLVKIIEFHPDVRYAISAFDGVASVVDAVRSTTGSISPSGGVAEALDNLKEGNRHSLLGKIAGKLVRGGWTPKDALALLRPHWERVATQGHEMPYDELKAMVEHAYQKHLTSHSNGKAEGGPEYIASFPGLVDLVEDKDQVAFLVKEGKQLAVRAEAEVDGVRYLPPPKEQIPWLLPRASEVLRHYTTDTDAALYDALLAHHKAISELSHEDFYDLLVAWDFHTYLLEAFQYSPMVWLFGVPERGKSRTGKGMIYVAYRGMHVESLREAYLLRMAKNCHATIFFDVMEFWNKAKQEGSDDILLHRFEKGAVVARVQFPERGAFRDMVYYPVFGASIIGTNAPVHPILETRCLMLTMPPSGRTFDGDVKKEAGLPLKERLVAFRARWIGHPLPEIVKPVPGRLGDMTRPLVQTVMFVRPERESVLRRAILTLEKGRKEEKGDTMEAELLLVIRDSKPPVVNGKLAVGQITDTFNCNRSEKEKVRVHSIGWKLKALGFEKTHMSDSKAAIYWNEAKLNKLLEDHGLSKTSETQETQSPAQKDT